MSAKSKLRDALDSIDNAKRALKKAKALNPEDPNVRKALRELEDAEDEIENAIRGVGDS